MGTSGGATSGTSRGTSSGTISGTVLLATVGMGRVNRVNRAVNGPNLLSKMMQLTKLKKTMLGWLMIQCLLQHNGQMFTLHGQGTGLVIKEKGRLITSVRIQMTGRNLHLSQTEDKIRHIDKNLSPGGNKVHFNIIAAVSFHKDLITGHQILLQMTGTTSHSKAIIGHILLMLINPFILKQKNLREKIIMIIQIS